MKKALVAILSLVWISGCGTPLVTASLSLSFPEQGLTDVQTLAAGTYKVVGIRSLTVDAAKGAKSAFSQVFNGPGKVESEDSFQRLSDWGSVKKGDESLQLTMEVNLPYTLEASGEKVDFNERHCYWHYQTSADGWGWKATGGESPNGFRFHEAIKKENLEKSIYTHKEGSNTARITSVLNDKEKLVSIFVEVKIKGSDGKDDTTQIIEMLYRKVK